MSKPHIPHWAPGHKNLRYKGSAKHARAHSKREHAPGHTPGGSHKGAHYLNPNYGL